MKKWYLEHGPKDIFGELNESNFRVIGNLEWETKRQTSEKELKAAYKEICAGDWDKIIFLYTGHMGEYGDFMLDQPINFYDNMELLRPICKAKEVEFILDCCHSGTWAEDKMVAGYHRNKKLLPFRLKVHCLTDELTESEWGAGKFVYGAGWP